MPCTDNKEYGYPLLSKRFRENPKKNNEVTHIYLKCMTDKCSFFANLFPDGSFSPTKINYHTTECRLVKIADHKTNLTLDNFKAIDAEKTFLIKDIKILKRKQKSKEMLENESTDKNQSNNNSKELSASKIAENLIDDPIIEKNLVFYDFYNKVWAFLDYENKQELFDSEEIYLFIDKESVANYTLISVKIKNKKDLITVAFGLVLKYNTHCIREFLTIIKMTLSEFYNKNWDPSNVYVESGDINILYFYFFIYLIYSNFAYFTIHFP